ncbi:MAG: lytic murein transglycosylase B [Pseudomonadota bacterium]
MSKGLSCAAWLALVAVANVAHALDVADADVAAFIETTARERSIDSAWLTELLADAQVKSSIVKAISRPAERTKPWHDYRDLFVREPRISAGARFWASQREALDATSERYGIPPRVFVAILGIETNYGTTQGGYRVIDALSTLAFAYPPRAKFFRSELTRFLELAHAGDLDPHTAMGSYAGAMGAPQFMPSSYMAYAVDANEDGSRDLWQNWPDIIASIGNYLDEHGWRPGEPIVVPATLTAGTDPASLPATKLALSHTVGSLRAAGLRIDEALADDAKAVFMRLDGDDGPEYWVGLRNFYVITRYNHSVLYAMAVVTLGRSVADKLEQAAR